MYDTQGMTFLTLEIRDPTAYIRTKEKSESDRPGIFM